MISVTSNSCINWKDIEKPFADVQFFASHLYPDEAK